MSIEDQPTQQIQRPGAPAPMPGPLNPAAPPPAPAPEEMADNGSNEVLSLDDLLDGPATPALASPVAAAPAAPAATAATASVETPPVAATPITTTPAVPPAPPPAPATAPAAPRIGAVPVRSGQTSTPGTGGRLRGDAVAAWRGGLDRSRTWITAGDNAVIAATVLVALMLLLVVALV